MCAAFFCFLSSDFVEDLGLYIGLWFENGERRWKVILESGLDFGNDG